MKPYFPHSHRAQVEVPVPWLESPHDGERNRVMFDALRTVISQRNYALQWEDISFRTETVRRSAPRNGFRLSYHSYGDVRHVWRIKETPIPYFYSFDRLGFSAWSEIGMFPEQYREHVESVDPALARSFCLELRDWLVSENLSEYQQTATQHSLPEKFIFFPLQIRGDIVAKFCRIDPIRVLLEAARQARHHKIPLVVKRHPYCTSKLTRWAIEFARRSNPFVVVSDASVAQLLSGCDAVIVANSGVGFEALIYGKPVHSFASSEYTLASYRIDHLSDIESAFTNPDQGMIDTGRRFAQFFLENLCFDCRKPSTITSMLDLAELSANHEIWCEKDRFLIRKNMNSSKA